MTKVLSVLITILLFIIFSKPNLVFAQNSFASVINPIRGSDFWDISDQSIETAFLGESEILKKYQVSATWLIRYDVFLNQSLISKLKNLTTDEKGLFLEITPTWTKDAGVEYPKLESWHSAGSAFLTGYEPKEREKLIDVAFEKFKLIFGQYPKSVGAWWIDAYSLNYMQKKYGIIAALIVADQYSTDNYQIWGQYFSTPYFPDKKNALHPAQNLSEKLPIVIVQWASRDPVNSYGNGVSESTYSLQANDYIDYHNLDTSYFSKLIDTYTNQTLNTFAHVVVGLENSYLWSKYAKEYENQINSLVNKRNQGKISLVSLEEFALWYKNAFPELSPEHIIISDDPLGTYRKTVWFMNPFYRVGWFYNQDGSVFRDIRQYINGSEELCFNKRCNEINFATNAIRVLDEVSFGHKWVLDPGKITDFKVIKEGLNYVITYNNEAGKSKKVEFLPRDISVDGKILSIDTTILEATKNNIAEKQKQNLQLSLPKISIPVIIFDVIKFILFLIFACLIPGFIFTKDINKPLIQKAFLSVIVGLVLLTLMFYIVSVLKIKPLIYLYIVLNLAIFIRLKLYKLTLKLINIKRLNLIIILLIVAGTIFQVIPTFKSGLEYSYGLGFWGPNTHDGMWHIALINQLLKNVPPQNPVFANVVLKNYHFFYDLLVAGASYLTQISITNLLFRFFPIVFSLCLGIGSYYLMQSLFKKKIAILFGLYLVYFAGSFGWIVEFIKQRHFGGESAFWANQSISFNLNPPFAASLVIIIALLQLLPFEVKLTKKTFLINVILIGCLISFKSYAGVLILLTLLIFGFIELIKNRNLTFIILFFFGGILSAFLFLSNFRLSGALLIVSPFWFINSMIDSPDRVGWVRLSLMRMVGESSKNWIKLITAESLSFAIFIFGNLGIRFLSFGVFFKLDKIKENKLLIFIAIFAFCSVFIPTIFIQAGNPWNTIQFIYYYLYIAALFSGIVFSWIVFKLPKIVGLIFVTMMLILAPINSIVTASGYIPQSPHAYISKDEIQGLNFLSSQNDGIVLTYPYDKGLKNEIAEPWPLLAYDSTAYVAAFSKKGVYMEDLGQNQILLTDYKKRLVASNDFFLSPLVQQIKFLNDNNIKYIYVPKVFGKVLDEEKGIKNIFENKDVIIYKYN